MKPESFFLIYSFVSPLQIKIGALNVKFRYFKNVSPNKYVICLQYGAVPNSIHSEKHI